jgi:hypothetical protein
MVQRHGSANRTRFVGASDISAITEQPNTALTISVFPFRLRALSLPWTLLGRMSRPALRALQVQGWISTTGALVLLAACAARRRFLAVPCHDLP